MVLGSVVVSQWRQHYKVSTNAHCHKSRVHLDVIRDVVNVANSLEFNKQANRRVLFKDQPASFRVSDILKVLWTCVWPSLLVLIGHSQRM